MPGKVKVRVLAARNLPVMDRSSDTTDAFAEVKLGDVTFKTEVFRKSLHPAWNSDWYRFDVDDCDLQEEPLQIRIMDYDTYSANDAIGKVYIDLNPLLLKADSHRADSQKQIMLSGWLPIYDTMHGVRGEVNVQVKVELFSDLNKFRTSSCGVVFFCTSAIPEGYKVQCINGFVEKLVINDDPEYQWIDKIRTPRASNEARQTLFMKLSSTVQRKIGLMALELGANAVIGYKQNFDLEGDTGIVVRGIGTAVTLVKQQDTLDFKEYQEPAAVAAASSTANAAKTSSANASSVSVPGASSRHASGESEVASVSTSAVAGCSPKGYQQPQPQFISSLKMASKQAPKDGLEILEYPFLTLHSFPEGFIQRLGGLVCCRSVKLLDGELEENRMQRENWWQEIRQEIRSHARCLGCNLVIGYTEDTSIWEDIVVLSASGTAVVGNLNYMLDLESVGVFGPPYVPLTSRPSVVSKPPQLEENQRNNTCGLLHITPGDSLPFSWRVNKCHACGKFPVPDVMFTTIEPPVTLLGVVGRGCLLQATVLRPKKDLKGESNAKEISDALPFIEYELHRQLLNKLKVKGMNALFGLKMSLSISDRVMVATASGTGVHLSGLAAPTPPRLVHHREDKEYLHRMQRRLEEKISENMTYHGINDESRRRSMSFDDEVEDLEYDGDAGVDNDVVFGNKETCVLEIDDSEDAEILDSILDRFPPPGVQVFSTEELVGISSGHFVRTSQMFTQVWRGRVQPTTKDLTRICQKLLSSIYFKLRRLKPCLISKLQLKVDTDDEYDLQLTISGLAIALAHGGKTREDLIKEVASIDADESDEVSEARSASSIAIPRLVKSMHFFVEAKAPEGIMLTPQTYICGAKIDKYLGNLNFFLIRETSGLREAGGLSSFIQSFICEIHAIMRSHVLALGGNGLVSYFMSEFVIMHNPHKNQAQCLIHVGGDAVQVTYLTS